MLEVIKRIAGENMKRSVLDAMRYERQARNSDNDAPRPDLLKP